MGYGDQQLRDLQATIAAAVAAGVSAVAIGTPIDLAALVSIPVPATRVRYTLRMHDPAALPRLLQPVIERGVAATLT
jgi:hypothetical protein